MVQLKGVGPVVISRFSATVVAAVAAGVLGLTAGAEGFRTSVGDGQARFPVVIVRGNAYARGLAQGILLRHEVQRLMASMAQVRAEGGRYRDVSLDAAWDSVRPHLSERWVDELRGVADGAEVPLRALIRAHMVPVVSNYSCSGGSFWGDATSDGRLYQFRNLDHSMDMGLQDVPAIVVSIPEQGLAHVNLTFAGFVGVQTGMNAAGTVLSEMGDSSGDDYPFDMNGVPFFVLFSDLLYEADSLERALAIIQAAPRIKKYHYIVGNGRDLAAAKLRAHAPDLRIWRDEDPDDEVAPDVYRGIVYNAESRDPIACAHIRQWYGQYDAQRVIDLTRSVPIRGSNLMAAVYDATELRLWVSYARGDVEAFERPFVPVDFGALIRYRPEDYEVELEVTVNP
jgi:hypothetical protein